MGHHHIGFLDGVHKALDWKQRVAGIVHEVAGKIKLGVTASSALHDSFHIDWCSHSDLR